MRLTDSPVLLPIQNIANMPTLHKATIRSSNRSSSKKGNPKHILKPKDLSGKTVAVQEGNLFDEKLLSKYANVKIVYAKDYRALSDMVISGKADAFIGSDLTNYNLIDLSITSVEPVFTLGTPLHLVFAIRKDWPELVSILDKELIKLSQKERNTIKEHYIIRTAPFDFSLLWKIALGFAALLLILFWWNRLLTKKVAEGIQKYKQQEHLLIQQTKMAEIGETMRAILHQWKQPLNIISISNGIIESINKESARPDEDIDESTDHIRKQIEFMTATVNDFKLFFTPAKTNVMFMPCEILEKIKTMFIGVFEKKGITIEIAEHEHFTAMGSPSEFMQVVLNLFNNAKDAMHEKEQKEGHIHCFIETGKDWGTIRIRDDAGGIPKELLPKKIFEPNFTTKGEEGSGIGLLICKNIIEHKMNGKLSAANWEKGAEFTIELPIAKHL